MYHIEEGIVVKKGWRKEVLLGGLALSLVAPAWDGLPQPKKGYYWARVKIPSFDNLLLVRSNYNFKIGTTVRVKYKQPDPNYAPDSGELVIDWE